MFRILIDNTKKDLNAQLETLRDLLEDGQNRESQLEKNITDIQTGFEKSVFKAGQTDQTKKNNNIFSSIDFLTLN